MQNSKLKFKVQNFKKGFTLVEMVVVIAILAILVTGVIVLLDPLSQLKKGRDGQRKSDLRQIQSALEMYRSDQGGYITGSAVANCSSSIMSPDCVTSTYLKTVPNDPSAGSYFYYGSATNYCLRACLENTNDSQKDATNNESIAACATLGTCASGKWSYTLQNP